MPSKTSIRDLCKRISSSASAISSVGLEVVAVFQTYLRGFDPDLAAELLGDTASEFFLCLQWISLHFMEQDPEMPPANLRLEFVRGQFPQAIWSKGANQSEQPESFWQLAETPFMQASNPFLRLHISFTASLCPPLRMTKKRVPITYKSCSPEKRPLNH